MSESEHRPRIFLFELIQPGDIVLTTTPEPVSRTIRKATGADISHAMICVATASVIDSTGDGVHARNLQRILLEPGCAGHVLRPVRPLTIDQLSSVIVFARAAVGTRYTVSGAVKSVLAGFVAGRRQYCSRLVAQAYRDAGVDLVSDADFCHPGELLASAALVEVPNILRSLDAAEEVHWRESIDHVQVMRESTDVLLRDARKLSSDIESLNDIDVYLIEHPESDAQLVQALQNSRYLQLWRDEFDRNSWQYDSASIEWEVGLADYKETYCKVLLADEELCPNRFVSSRAGYVTMNTSHPRVYFTLMLDLYDRLAHLHALRINAATDWLELKGLRQRAPPVLLRPHTPEWFASLGKWNPVQAAMTHSFIQMAKSPHVCSVCGDDPARDYALKTSPPGGPATLRLCDDCHGIRSGMEPMRPF